MNVNLEQLMYHSGLTAQGCWDQMDAYDKEAIMKLSELIVRECAAVALRENHEPSDCILRHFGVKSETHTNR